MTEDNEVYFGDIAVSFIVDKSTDISKEIVEKNFVDSPPKVYELTPDLESGSYDIIMNEKYHPKEESFEEQRDAIRSMTFRNLAEFPVEIGSDKGHIIPESTTVSLTPSQQVEEGEISIRFLEDFQYQPVIKSNEDRRGDFDVENSSLVPIPSIAEDVSQTEDYTIETEEGDIHLYSSDELISYNLPESYSEIERIAPVRLYSEDEERVYSDKLTRSNSTLGNNIIKAEFSDSQVVVDYFDGSWQETLFSVDVSNDGYAYAETNENYAVKLNWRDGYNSTIYRGLPLIEFELFGADSFDLFSASPIELEEEDYYYVIEEDEYEIVLVRMDDVGEFYIDDDDFGVEELDFEDVIIKVGIVPEGFETEDFAQYIYNYDKPRRTFQQK